MIKPLFFSVTLLLSSALIFLIQFMSAKMVLPLLGGTPAVWNTCMVFFQAGLLLGYALAHWGPLTLGLRNHALLHLALLTGAFFTLPINLQPNSNPPEEPIFWLLGLLAMGVGLPFVVLASTGPLLQRWFVSGPGKGNPYFLYAASNLGSMVGLLSYPFVLEPNLTLHQQNVLWKWSFGILIILLAGCALWTRQSPTAPGPTLPDQDSEQPRPGGWLVRLRWVLLALVPASLMLSVTSYLTTDIAAIPLLWVVPIALYLFSMVLVFARFPLRLQAFLTRWLPGIVMLILVVLLAEGNDPIELILLLHLFGFFWIALVCHGQLASSKPPPSHLTEFYLWLALGGVLGGMINALVAPLIFPGVVEYPLMLVLAAWLNPREKEVRANLPGHLALPTKTWDILFPLLVGLLTWGLIREVSTHLPPGKWNVALMFCLPGFLCLLVAEKPARFGLSLAALLLASSLYEGVHGKLTYRERSFFGVHRVTEANGFRNLIHGNTVHGMQHLHPQRRAEPLTYYYRTGPIGQVFTLLTGDPRKDRVGLVGLGAGALASYAHLGQHWTFFEIDPAVIYIARDSGLFTFLQDSPAQIDVIPGDARLTLEQSPDKFGVLVIDAFGSDSIPLHLLTREAFAIYRSRLQPGGFLAFHISNRYLDLEPILANLAHEAHWLAAIRQDSSPPGTGDHRMGKFPSHWILLAQKKEDLSFLGRTSQWFPARPQPHLPPWTDDFSNIFHALHLRKED